MSGYESVFFFKARIPPAKRESFPGIFFACYFGESVYIVPTSILLLALGFHLTIRPMAGNIEKFIAFCLIAGAVILEKLTPVIENQEAVGCSATEFTGKALNPVAPKHD